MDQVVKELQEIPQIDNSSMVAGFGMGSGNGSSHGMFIIKLKHWDERQDEKVVLMLFRPKFTEGLLTSRMPTYLFSLHL